MRPTDGSAGGSSPLARGLPRDNQDRIESDGIIPARAGFTAAGTPRHPPRSDHPRSRGVYSEEYAAGLAERGSSPLARGLPVGASGVMAEDGIIPARAGFTRRCMVRRWRRRDHPRSRGVYHPEPMGPALGGGSSPLARGLQGQSCGGTRGGRIIPARAGFTSPRRRHSPAGTDHPRSRGVYGVA